MQLVIGLGNPGKRYARTRHNVGFMVLDTMVQQWELKPAWAASLAKRGQTLYLKPQTYMNLSGSAVLTVSHYYKIAPADIIVIYDDKDLPFGTVRQRLRGSAGGHRGMQSIISCLGSEAMARLKIGIAPDAAATIEDTADFVLDRFTAVELTQLPEVIAATITKLRVWLKK